MVSVQKAASVIKKMGSHLPPVRRTSLRVPVQVDIRSNRNSKNKMWNSYSKSVQQIHMNKTEIASQVKTTAAEGALAFRERKSNKVRLREL